MRVRRGDRTTLLGRVDRPLFRGSQRRGADPGGVLTVDILIGVDLGQFSSFAAASVLRRTVLYDRDGQPERTSAGADLCRFDVMALRRYAHGTAYTDVVAHVVD